MTSLSETYGGRGRSEVDPRRLSVGVGLFVGGALLLVTGILVAAEVLAPGGYTSGAARRLGGILGGLGVPLVLLGVMTVLPADRRTRASAVAGAAIMGLGVALFSQAYPNHWVGGPRPELVDLTLPTAGVYFLGAATMMWCVFVGVANFKTRNDPGGTVTMEVTHEGETKIIEVDRDQVGVGGGVGLLGSTPDGNVETQTNRGGTAELTGSGVAPAGGGTPSGLSDGGDASTEISSPLDRTDGESGSASSTPASAGSPSTPAATRSSQSDGSSSSVSSQSDGSSPSNVSSPLDAPSSPSADGDATADPGDTYCGNCAEFDYVRTDQGMRPYCGHYDELMDDMEACEQWTPR